MGDVLKAVMQNILVSLVVVLCATLLVVVIKFGVIAIVALHNI